jgi:hypothetical protein
LRTRYRKASNHHRPATLTSDKSLGDGAENEYGNEDRYAKGCLDDSSHLLPERRRSAARDLEFSTPTDFIASPLHRLVLPYPELDRSELQISLFA